MTPFPLDIALVAGDDETLEFKFENTDGTPLDLTDRTYFLEVRSTPQSTGPANCTFSCYVPDPELGVVVATADGAATAGMSPGKGFWWSLLQVTAGTPDGETLVWGRVEVIPQVTKAGS